MTIDVRGSAALVTGASRGIGRAVAVGLAAAGCDVALVARAESSLEQTADACRGLGVRVVGIAADLGEPDAASAVVAQAVEAHGRLDVLVNNAGLMTMGSVADVEPEKWRALMDVNVLAPMRLSKAALPHLVKRSRSAIVNIGSIAGRSTYAGGAGYCASKHALMGFSGSLFDDVREQGVKVCVICPGFVKTDMVAGHGLDGDKMIQPEDVAATVLFVVRHADTVCPTEIVLRPQRTPYV